MYRKSITRAIFFLFLFFSISSIFFTQIYLNSFKTSFQRIIASFLEVDEFSYSHIQGNLIKGFDIADLSITSAEYSFNSKKSYIDINLGHILNNQKKINSIKLDDVKIFLDKISFSNNTNRSIIKKVEIKDVQIVYRDDSVFVEKIELLEKYESEDDFYYFLKGYNGNGHLWGFNLNIQEIKSQIFSDYFKYVAEIDNFESTSITFEKIRLSGEGRAVTDFTSKFEGINTKILDKNFSDFFGEVAYLNNTFFIHLDEIDEKNAKDYSLLGTINIQDTLINLNSVNLKIKNDESILIEDKVFFVNTESWYGEDINLKYKNGNLFVKNFEIKSLNDYFFELQFEEFDINLFKGLKAGGYLSGNLNLSNTQGVNSAIFSNAKIEDFSYEDYSFDSVKMEGAFNDNELELSDLKLSKQIGFLDVSGSFSSLDNFYNKVIHKLKLKIKL